MREVPPCVVSGFTSFVSHPNIGSTSENSENTFGCISRDGMWSWIARGALLEVFSVQTKERCAVYCFGAKCNNSSLSITAIEEFSSSHLSFPCLLVGLDTLSDGGLLCVVNVKTSKVISAIQLPYKVTSLEIISSLGGATMETYMLNNQLRYLFGIAAVGTEGGNVFLVDLCLDTENYSDEMMPNKATIVSKTIHSLPAKREVAATKNQHICIFLNDNNFNCDTFEYRNSNTLLANFSPGDVIVSALKYVRNLAVLVVGFNFGGIQLWNLQHLSLEISIPIYASQQPLVHFAFQEPENDPRNFCYLWAVRGHYQGENYRPENVSVATLYALAYAKREWIPRYGFFYQVLQSCTKRFEYALTSDPYNPLLNCSSHCSRLITCAVISQADLLAKLDIDDSLQNEEWGSAEDLGLCLMAWENWPTTGGKPASSYLALFDINQWYQAQMPSLLRCNYGEMCSYLGVFSLKEVSKKMDLLSLLAVSLVPNTASRFKSISMAEETFFPSSLSFKIWCMSTQGILQATYLGAQRQLLAEMNLVGPNILIDPKELYNRCLSNGLLNQLAIGSSGKQLTVARQRETLLTLALEHNMVQFLSACVQSWKRTEFIHTGCSSKFMLEWVWKIITQIKTTIDKLCHPLFNCSGQGLDENSLITLHIFKSRLKYLSDVIAAFQNLAVPQTEQGQMELQLRREVVDSISVYLNVMLWLYDCKLLPEHPEGDEFGEDEVAYPVTVFNRTYSYRRNELQKIHSFVSEHEILLVDGLVEEFGESLGTMWERKGGTKTYPPPSIYAAISSYLVDAVSLSQRHMLMYYLLLDMTAYLTDHQSHLLEKLSMFCPSNDISPSLNKLTQAFWHLDHQDYETAVSILVDPVVLSSDIAAWQHSRILKSLLYQGQPQKALKYINIRTPPEDTEEAVKLHLSVLVANGLIGDAFSYLRQHQDDSNFDELLTHVFFGCQQTQCLDSLLHLPLNVFESSALSDYLNSCRDPKAPELLVMFHLLRCRPLEASSLNDKLITQVMERGTKCRERATARNALVAGFVDTLPEEQKKLAQELSQVYARIDKREVTISKPQPLSTNVTSKTLMCMSHADLLRNVMVKVADSTDASNAASHTPFRSSKSSISSAPFIRPPITPESRKRKRSGEYMTTPRFGKSLSTRIDSSEYSTPLKRPRSFDIRSFILSDTDSRRVKSPLHKSLLSLLQTPPISRVASSSRDMKLMSVSVPQTTPLSILKTKSTSQPPVSPSEEHLYSKTPSVCSEMSKDEQMSEGEIYFDKKAEDVLQPRHLRFQEPSPSASVQSIKSSRASPRRPLREDERSTFRNTWSTSIADDVRLTAATPPKVEFTSEHPLSVETHDEIEQPDLQNFSLHYSDSDSRSENKSDNCSYSSNPEEVCGSQAGSTADVQNYDSCASADASFVSLTDQSGDITIKANGSQKSESGSSFQSMDENDDCVEFHADTKSCTDSSSDVPALVIEMDHYGQTTPEKKEDSHSSSPYLSTRSRSRSKSLSPSRSVTKNPMTTVIHKSVALFTAAEHDQKTNNDLPEDGGSIPMLEAELPRPGTLTRGKKQDFRYESPCRLGRSRSRSKSASPSRNLVPKSPVVLNPELPLTVPDLQTELNVKEDEPKIPTFEGNVSPPKTPERIQDDDSSSSLPPYLGTRSKSISPSRTRREAFSAELAPLPEQGEKLDVEQEERGQDTDSSCSDEQSLPTSESRDQAPEVDQSSSESASNQSKPSPELIKSNSRSVRSQKECTSEDLPREVKTSAMSQADRHSPEASNQTEEKKDVPQSKQRTVRKKKIKSTNAKTAEKIEFSFSKPHSAADSEILEALSSSPSTSVPTFVFSPPAARTRYRQKKFNESLNISTVVSSTKTATSARRVSAVPQHPDDNGASNVMNVSSRQKASSSLRKNSKAAHISSSQNYINFISPVATAAASPERHNRPLSTTKHSMTLRKAKKKSVKLF